MRTAFAFVLALTACKAAADSRDRSPHPAAPAAAPMPTAPTTSSAPGSANLRPLAGLGARLRGESTQRPIVRVTAERLFSSLGDRGIELQSTKQVLATVAQARYCALGVTKENIAVAICEYASVDAARAGKKLLDSRYGKLVPDAVRTLNGNTLLTVANGTTHREVRDRVLETFASL